MKKVLYILIALCLYACNQKEEVKEVKLTEPVKAEVKPAKANNDKYVYIDAVRILHVRKRCAEFLPLMYEGISSESTIYLHGIRYILKNYLVSGHFSEYCSQCTEVEDYEEIEDIIRINENRRTAYNTLDRYYNMPSFEEFDKKLNSEEGRRKAYNALKEEGCKDFGDSYAEFINAISRELEDDYWEQCRIVYMSDTNVYHYDRDCGHITVDNGEVEELTVEDAEKQNLKPCKFCIDKK